MRNMNALLLTGAMLLAVSRAATAVPILPSDFSVQWNIPVSGGLVGSATAQFSGFTFITPSEVQFNLNVTNTSTGTSPGTDVRFTSFGWQSSETLTAVSSSNTSVFGTELSTNLSSFSVDVCFFGGSNCNGGGNGGLEDPQNTGLHGDPTTTGNLLITMNFAGPISVLNFDNFAGKFQSAVGSVEGLGCVGGDCSPPTKVPEPQGPLLLGIGLVLLGVSRLRKRIARR